MFSEQDIRNIYTHNVKLPDSYFRKYERLPPCPVKRYGHNWGNYDFPRNWCILDFIEWTRKYDIKPKHVGYTSEADPELEFLQSETSTYLPYPAHDLHTIAESAPKNEFDFFIFNQTLEHLYNPFLAVKNIFEIMKPGGWVFTSVPTLNIPHMTPIHFNGFTPMGLAMLFKTAGFEVVEVGQWGNLDYINKLWRSHWWPGYQDLQNNGVVSNEERNVCQCWILVRKPI